MSNNEVKFANGMIVKPRHPKCPDYVIANLSVKVEDFEQTMKANHVQGWLNIQLKVSQGGKPYAQIDEWRPQAQQYPQQQPQQGYGQPQQGYSQPPPPFPTDNANAQQVPPPPRPADNSNAFDVTEESIDDIPF